MFLSVRGWIAWSISVSPIYMNYWASVKWFAVWF